MALRASFSSSVFSLTSTSDDIHLPVSEFVHPIEAADVCRGVVPARGAKASTRRTENIPTTSTPANEVNLISIALETVKWSDQAQLDSAQHKNEPANRINHQRQPVEQKNNRRTVANSHCHLVRASRQVLCGHDYLDSKWLRQSDKLLK